MSATITSISAIQPSENGKTIEVRVYRIWRGKILNPIERNEDECKEAYYDYVKEKLMVGSVYRISKFHSKESQDKYIIVEHRTQLLFNNRTQFIPLPELPDIPQHWFRFVDFDKLLMRENNDTVLTDLIGRLKLMYPLEEEFINGRKALKRLLRIQDARRQDLKLTLWGTLASEFDVDMIKTLPPLVVMAFTSTKVRRFENTIMNSELSTCLFINPAIPEIEEYRANFNKPYHAPKFITTSSARHEPAPDYGHEDVINVSTLNLQAEKKKTRVPLLSAKLRFQSSWFNKASITWVAPPVGRLSGWIIIWEIFVVEIMESRLVIPCKAVDTLFGIACHELVNEKGEDDKYNAAPTIEKAKNQYHVWRIGYGLRDDFLVKNVYLENRNDEKLFIYDTMSHPTTPAKRATQPQKEETLKELLNMEIKKKQKRGERSKGLPKINQTKLSPRQRRTKDSVLILDNGYIYARSPAIDAKLLIGSPLWDFEITHLWEFEIVGKLPASCSLSSISVITRENLFRRKVVASSGIEILIRTYALFFLVEQFLLRNKVFAFGLATALSKLNKLRFIDFDDSSLLYSINRYGHRDPNSSSGTAKIKQVKITVWFLGLKQKVPSRVTINLVALFGPDGGK
ncbi:hypothetical protein ACLB2K_028088 [Fragaria x ananassa]